MNRQCQLSNVAKDYLETFRCILDEMIQGMTGAALTDSISENFIVQMIPHHQAAIEMSRNILQYTTNLPLQEIALNIVEEQTRSIENMRRIQEVCRKCVSSEQELCHYQDRMDRIMQVMFCGMEQACGTNQINGDFIREMIPHHRGAVEMSRTALQYGICQELVPVLEAIIESQERGICRMRRLLRCMGCNS